MAKFFLGVLTAIVVVTTVYSFYIENFIGMVIAVIMASLTSFILGIVVAADPHK